MNQALYQGNLYQTKQALWHCKPAMFYINQVIYHMKHALHQWKQTLYHMIQALYKEKHLMNLATYQRNGLEHCL